MKPKGGLILLVAPMLAALAACSVTGGGSTSPATTGATGSGIGERVSSALFGPPAQPGQGAAEPEQPDCPPLDVRQGASTITVYGPGDPNATNVRYQATVSQLARECAALGAVMTIKVGLQGRVILGPKGGPGRLDVPIRIAVVHEGPEPKTIWTKLYKTSVDIPSGQLNVPFVHVEDDLTFPMPRAGDLEAYVIYAGFDQKGVSGKGSAVTRGGDGRPRGRRTGAAR